MHNVKQNVAAEQFHWPWAFLTLKLNSKTKGLGKRQKNGFWMGVELWMVEWEGNPSSDLRLYLLLSTSVGWQSNSEAFLLLSPFLVSQDSTYSR